MTQWKPVLDTRILDERMDNAMRRASGAVGLDIAFDKGRMRAMKDTAADAVEAGLSSPGPLFMRVGQGVFEAGMCKLGQALDPKMIAGEILREFFQEAGPAFLAGKAALRAEALARMRESGVDAAHCQAVLDAADAAYALPEKDAFTGIGMRFVKKGFRPSTAAAAGALAGYVGFFLLTRVPHIGIACGIAGGGAGYYFARTGERRRCENILRVLPRALYDQLATEWNANIRRYAETVNAGAVREGVSAPESAARE